jgi:hypothetical protein
MDISSLSKSSNKIDAIQLPLPAEESITKVDWHQSEHVTLVVLSSKALRMFSILDDMK